MEAVAKGTVLSDSLLRTRPTFASLLMSDANANGNSVQQIQEKRRIRQMKFPSVVGRSDVDSFKEAQNPTSLSYMRYNDEGDYRVAGPLRACDNILDPVSGLVSVAGDVDRGTGHGRVRSLVQLPHAPHSATPQTRHSVRLHLTAAPPETRRQTEHDPGAPYLWNSRQVLDGAIRGKLGGWTSDVDPRVSSSQPLRGMKDREDGVKSVKIKFRLSPASKVKCQKLFVLVEEAFSNPVAAPPRTPADENREIRDKLSLRYQYTPSTQRMYEELPWDTMLPPKVWPPVSTLEDRPDMISQRWTLKRYAPRAEEWQATGRAWDWFQRRRGQYKEGPIPGTVFCTPCPRAQQIPMYSGCIGGTNLEEIDNAKEPFQPLTVKRVNLPRYTDTAHRPTIPRFAGSTPQPDAGPIGPVNGMIGMTSSGNYRPLPVGPNVSEHKRESQMSKMVTTVPPCNPFNKVVRREVTC